MRGLPTQSEMLTAGRPSRRTKPNVSVSSRIKCSSSKRLILRPNRRRSPALRRSRSHGFEHRGLARRFLAAELRLSFVPDAEQRTWRCLSRSKHQKRRRRVQIQNQIEALLEESQIKLSSVITDLLGVAGYRMLKALAEGETDPAKLVALAADNLRASKEQLAEAVSGPMQSRHRRVLAMQLEELDLLDKHIAELSRQLGDALRFHQDAVLRLCEMPGVREDAAWQMIAELGPEAAAFETAEQMASWIGVCPGREESAAESKSNRSPKGNRTMRRVLNQVAWGSASGRRIASSGNCIIA